MPWWGRRRSLGRLETNGKNLNSLTVRGRKKKFRFRQPVGKRRCHMPLNEQKNGTSISKSIISKNNNRKRKNKQTVPVIFYFLFEFLGTQSSVAMSTVKIRKRKKSSHGIEKLLRAGGAGAHLVTTADPPTSAPETNRQRHGDGGNICFIFYFISCSCENIPQCSREISTSFVMLRPIGIKCNDKNKKQ